jgi:hypothetical protein
LDFDSDDDMGADEVAIISWRGILEMLADGTSDLAARLSKLR